MSRFTVDRYWEETEPPWDRGDVPWIVRIAVRWGITIVGLLVAAAIFVVMRAVLRPVLIFLTCALQLITLGLFIFVVNALILLATDAVCDWWGINFEVDGFFAALLGAFVISVVSFVLSRFLRRNPLGPRLI